MRVRSRAKLSIFLFTLLISVLSTSSAIAEKKYDAKKKGPHCASYNQDACCTQGSRPTFWCVDPTIKSSRDNFVTKLPPKRTGTCVTHTLSSGYYNGDWYTCPKGEVRWESDNYDRTGLRYGETNRNRRSDRRRGGRITNMKRDPVTTTGSTNGSSNGSGQGSGGNNSGNGSGNNSGNGSGNASGGGSGSTPTANGSGNNSGQGSGSNSGQGSGNNSGQGSGNNSGQGSGGQASGGQASSQGSGQGSGTVGEISPDTPPPTAGGSATGTPTAGGSGNGSGNNSGQGSAGSAGMPTANGSGNNSGNGSGNNSGNGGSGSVGNPTANGSSNGSGNNSGQGSASSQGTGQGSGNNSGQGSASSQGSGQGTGNNSGQGSASSQGSNQGTGNNSGNGSGNASAGGSGSAPTAGGSGNGSGNASGNGSGQGSASSQGSGQGSGNNSGNGTGSDTSRQRKNVKVLSLTGGASAMASKRSFYDEAKSLSDATKKWGVTDKKFLYGPDGREICHTDHSDSIKADMLELRKKALVTPPEEQTCQQLSGYMMSDAMGRSGTKIKTLTCNRAKESTKTTDLSDYDFLGEPEWKQQNDLGDFVTGAANNSWSGQMSTMNLQSGDHFLLSINGTGDRFELKNSAGEVFSSGILLSNPAGSLDRSGDVDTFINSMARVTASDLRLMLQRITLKGVTVHLNVMGDHSGGFVRDFEEMNRSPNPVCAVSDTDEETFSFENNPLFPNGFRAKFNENLGTYGNQLEAMACSLAEDTVSKAESTLDEVVRQYSLSNVNDVPACTPEPFAEADKLAWEISQITEVTNKITSSTNFPTSSDAATNELRTKLLKAYQEKFVDRLKSCMKKARWEDRLIRKNVMECQAKLKKTNDILAQYDSWMTDKSPLELNMAAINKHIQFIKGARKADLERYQRAFCCLSFDLSKGMGDAGLCGN